MHIEKEYMLTGDRQEQLAAVAASLMKVWEALPQEKGQDWRYTCRYGSAGPHRLSEAICRGYPQHR